ncbi:DUF4352 domain-containing protein [Ornithinimicrobium cavernae]|uniref:DUF4352 domain-containing protein n=1 Tax=Ornithinimicrobium cavernae TaxID=2666047 RepID=UPI0012B166E0|nr:DUF4352 domain-containing protein [Ornithinimicrobium cavernae]
MTNTPPPPPPGQPHGQPQYGREWQDPHPDQPYGQGQPYPPGQQNWGPGHPPAPPVPPQPEAKKSWFRRHKIMTGLLALVALITVVNLASGGGNDSPTAADEPATVVEQAPAGNDAPDAAEKEAAEEKAAEEKAAEEKAAEEKAAEEKAAEEEAAEEEAAEAPGLEDAVRDGSFEFVVTGVETGLTTIGEGFTEESPQGQFVLIDITVTNIGDKGTTLFDSNQVLIDEQGRQHNTSSASIWLDEGLWLDEINPGNSMSGVLLYDIPADAVPTSLELHDSMFSGGVTVSLQ